MPTVPAPRTVRTLLAGLVLLLLAPLVVAAPAGAAVETVPGTVAPAETAVKGSSSGGDPYYPLDGNGGYQVRHYRIVATYRPDSDRLEGRTVVHATATQTLRAFHLDLALTPDAVRVDSVAARFGKPDPHELRVTPRTVLPDGEPFRVVVEYHGRPASARAAGQRPFSWESGEGVAVGQPQMGPWWFAANETPLDKATYDVVLRVPRGQEAISNGELVGRRDTARWSRWSWRMDEPMTTYLAFMAAGSFRVVEDEVDGRPAWYAVSRRLTPSARGSALDLLRRTPEVVAWLEDHLGPYPFSSTGGVVTAAPLGFLLENQSRPVYPYIGGPTASNVSLVVHEQAHQWFGDDVAVRRWRDIWVNEGLATYAEWLWAEEHGGRTVAERLRLEYDGRPATSSFWEVRVGDPGPRDLFDDAVYTRGAMTVAALRARIGERNLRTLLRTWVARNARGHGSDAAFRALADEVSNQDLDRFFRHWLDDTTRPENTEENGLA